MKTQLRFHPWRFTVAAILGFGCSAWSGEKSLTLNAYMDLAKNKDASWQASNLGRQGALKVRENAALISGLNLIANASYLSDGRPTMNPNFMGSKTVNRSYAFGVQQQSLLGVNWSLTQNYSYTRLYDASFIPTPKYFDAYPKLELSLNLWRNWLGAETSATQKQLDAQLQTQALRAEMAFLQKENEIKEAFYNLATQQKNYDTQKDSLRRAEKILGWAQSRLARNLADKGDVYQIQALVSARKMDLINAEMKLKEASRTFNSFLDNNSDQVEYALQLDDINLNELKLDKRIDKKRIDSEMEKENLKSIAANYQMQKEKNKPNLNLSLSYLRQGRDFDAASAQDNILEQRKENYMVGVQFSMPLDMANLNRSKEGFEDLRQSQLLAEKARQRGDSILWDNTVDQAEALAGQLKIIRDLEIIQKNKADLERTKYNNGRSTTYQVLTFEQDYVNTRNQRIMLERDLRKFINSLSLYR